MVRENIVNGAVSFLQDPSVASAPLEQRLAFLRSKNLTQEEIDVSLQRVGSEGVAPASQSQTTQNYQYQQPYRQGQNYGGPSNSYWQPPPPQEPPRRDWRDWFIMATVVGGIGYGALVLAQRYVLPIIAPPTPPQLEQDKASIDASFDKAFALIEQLAADTEELKSSEKARTERLDQALSEVEAVIGHMKDASKRRDEEVRRTNDEVQSLRNLIPKAIKAQEDSSDTRLKELTKEMQSLKTLMASRATAGRTSQPQLSTGQEGTANTNGAGNGVKPVAAETATALSNELRGMESTESFSGTSTNPTPSKPTTQSPYSARTMNGRAKIPAWQMAASKQGSDEDVQKTSESGTAVEATSA